MSEETSSDNNFTWWICMLPFIAAMGVFLYKWASNQSEQNYMWYAVGCLAGGIIFAAAVASCSGSPGSPEDKESPTQTSTTDTSEGARS